MKARVVCVPEVSADERIIPFWYRGSLNIDPLKSNGRQTELEKDIREFEAWQRKLTADRLPPSVPVSRGLTGRETPKSVARKF